MNRLDRAGTVVEHHIIIRDAAKQIKTENQVQDTGCEPRKDVGVVLIILEEPRVEGHKDRQTHHDDEYIK